MATGYLHDPHVHGDLITFVVTATDEFAGSDGDIVTAAVRLLGLGPVVGTRTWGGVIGIEGYQELVDGTSITGR
jgi:tricorn protease